MLGFEQGIASSNVFIIEALLGCGRIPEGRKTDATILKIAGTKLGHEP